MKKFLLFLFIGFGIFISGHAQNFRIVNTDVEQDTVIAELSTKASELKSTDIILTESGVKKDFSLRSSGNGQVTEPKYYCLLIETTGFTAPQALSHFKSALKQILPQMQPYDEVAILTFSQADKNQQVIKPILTFTKNKEEAITQLNKITALPDSNANADIFKAIYDACNWISNQKVNSVQLVVLTAGINHSYSSIKQTEAAEKAKKIKIPVYSLVHQSWKPYTGENFQRLADDTDGQSAIVGSEQETIDKLKAQMNISPSNTSEEHTYFIHFATDATSGETRSFEIEYANEKQKGEYTILSKTIQHSFFKQNLFLIIGLAGMLFIILAILLLRKKTPPKASNSPQEELQNTYSEPKNNPIDIKQTQYIPNPLVPPHSIPQGNLKQTMVMGHQTPALKLSYQNKVLTFPITTARITIGRNIGNDIQIEDETVSGSHAYIQFQGGNFYIFDNQSTNGTLIDRQKITEYKLSPNTVIKIGQATLEFILI